MILDVHSHLMWHPEHISEKFAAEALASKLVKLEQSGGNAYSARLDLHSYDSRPEDHWAAAQLADHTIVFGIQARATGVWVPNETVAEYVARHPERLTGWASIDPNEADAVTQLDYCVNELGLQGLKVGPAYQHFDPTDRRIWPLFERAQHHGIPVIWHQGATFPTQAWLRESNPLLLEPLTMAFPDLRMIVAHMAHPWEEDLIVLMRKAPNLYADISAVHYRPYRYWRTMIAAIEYGVTHKLLLGSDFPSATVLQVIDGLHAINDVVGGTKLPQVPDSVKQQIIFENWKRALPELR